MELPMMTFLKSFALFVAAGLTLIALMWGYSYFYLFFEGDDFYETESGQEYLIESSANDMRAIVIQLETYSEAFGFYPEVLEDALTGYVSDYDVSIPHCGCPYQYVYVTDAIGASYNLQSKGNDCEAYTQDDRFPALSPRESSAAGFTPIRIVEPALPSAGCGG